ncbi:MAG: DUF5652 family protein [Microgenomates group bacterium]
MEKINYQNLPIWAWSLLIFWTLFWKGWALWKASQKRQLLWFIILLVLNTTGLLEIAYIFYLNRWDLDKGRVLSFLEKIEKNLLKSKKTL